jgi:hypothetical protein
MRLQPLRPVQEQDREQHYHQADGNIKCAHRLSEPHYLSVVQWDRRAERKFSEGRRRDAKGTP